MNPQDFTYAQAVDPRTPQEVLTQIAQTRPDLLLALAQNPAIPADMVQWLSSLNDPQLNAALGQRASVPVPTPGPGFNPAQGVGQAQEFNQSQYQTPGLGYESASGPKKSKRGLLIGLIVAAALLIGGGVWAANHFLFGKLGGAQSPQAAVEKLLKGLEDQDTISVVGALSPVDVKWTGELSKSFFKHFEDDLDSSQFSDASVDLIEAFSMTATDVTYNVEDISDQYARVAITGGTFVIEGDAAKFAAGTSAMLEAVEGTYLGDLITESGVQFPTLEELEEEMTSAFEETFPLTLTAEDLKIDFESIGDSFDMMNSFDPFATDWDLDQDGANEEDKEPVYLVVSKEGGSWFVSPTLTTSDMQAKALGQTPDYSRIDKVQYSNTPEEAGSALVEELANAFTTLELGNFNQFFVEAERRSALVTPELPLDDYELDQYKEMMSMITISAADFSVDKQEGDFAYLKLNSLTISGDVEGMSAKVVLASDCTSIEADGMNMELCLQDIPAAQELGLDQLRLIAVKEKGGWVIGGNQSALDSLGILSSNVLRLAEEGKLTDAQWWIDNSGVLYQYLEEFGLTEDFDDF